MQKNASSLLEAAAVEPLDSISTEEEEELPKGRGFVYFAIANTASKREGRRSQFQRSLKMSGSPQLDTLRNFLLTPADQVEVKRPE